MKRFLRKFLKKRTQKLLETYSSDYADLLFNINADLTGADQKKVLICYITEPYKKPLGHSSFQHSNIYESIQISKYFISKGYIVDIFSVFKINYRDLLKENYYDVIFGFGKIYQEACAKNPKALKVFYLTENSPSTVKVKYDERVKYYEERNSKSPLDIKRTSLISEDQLDISDYAVVMSNAINIPTKALRGIYLINPSGLKNSAFKFGTKDAKESKKNFLWFGSAGAVHKGLDVLVDAFKNLDLHLHICGFNSQEHTVANLKASNIFDHGFIKVDSPEFLSLVDKCAFIILPSCSEGVSTSVLTCMLHGIIPVITKECGITLTPEMGKYLEDFKVDYIRDVVQQLQLLNEDQITTMSEAVYNYANSNFTLENFTKSFTTIMDGVFSKNSLARES